MLAPVLAVLALTPAPPPPPPAVVITVRLEEEAAVDPIQSVIDEYDAAYQNYLKLSRAASDDEEQQVANDHYPDEDEYAERIAKLAKRNPRTESALTGYLWILENSSAAALSKAVTAIERYHMDSERLGPLCATLSRDSQNGERLLQKILKKSPHESVRGEACFGLGRYYMIKADRAASSGSNRAPERAQSTAQKFFERVVDEFAEVESQRYGTLGAGAEWNLFQLRNLQIGMIAPDIEAADLDGVTFKLSDYRGKVVVLDFWGDW